MVLGIIQARINSDRFPIKIFAKFSDGSFVLERVIKQVLHSRMIDKIVIATNYLSHGFISSFVNNYFSGVRNISVFSGPDNDVLLRFVKCVDLFDDVDAIVRITADNPLTCPKYIDKAISLHFEEKADLTHFIGIPLGMGVEVIKPDTLYLVEVLTSLPYDREHVTPYIYKNKDKFKVLEPMYSLGDFQNLRVTIDTYNDLYFVDKLLKDIDYKIPVFVEDVIHKLSCLTKSTTHI